MDNIPKIMISFIIIVLAVMLCVSLVYTSTAVNAARTYHTSVIDQIEASNLENSTINKCIAQANADHYNVSITPVQSPESAPATYYKVSLTYKLTVPLFGHLHTGTYTGYALGGARVAVVQP